MKKLFLIPFAAVLMFFMTNFVYAYDVVNLPEKMTMSDAMGVFSYDAVNGGTINSYLDNKHVVMSEQAVKDFYYEFSGIQLERRVYATPFRGTAVTLDTDNGKKTFNLLSGIQIGVFGGGYVCYAPSDEDAKALMRFYGMYYDSEDRQDGLDVSVETTDFLKLPSDSWAVEPAQIAAERGLLPYALTNKYTANISREEFCDLIAKFICVNGNYGKLEDYMDDRGMAYSLNNFSDCTGRSENIDMLYALNIVSGRSDGTFDPDAPITRQEAAKMLCETASQFMYIETDSQANFTDRAQITDWARFYVAWVSEKWIMNGMDDGTFSPESYYTVQQAVTTVNRLYTVVNE